MTPGAALAAGGVVAAVIDGFQPRAVQQEMADAVALAIATRGNLICEAGTGTGKTFAYLVPALMAGVRTIVSTATRTLQDQLFQVDLPRVQAALKSAATVALLKGRANYLCLYRMERAAGDPLVAPRDRPDLARITAWSRRTVAGDIAEMAEVPEEAPIWPWVTSTVDNCLGQRCPRLDDCHVKEARRAAAAADLVVVNHHLLFADMALRDAGFGEILPTAQCIVIDEAHQIPELAANAFGQTLSARQLRELARDTDRAAKSEAPDMPDLRCATQIFEQGVTAAVETFAPLSGRQPESVLTQHKGLNERLLAIDQNLTGLLAQLALAEERGAELEICARRGRELAARLGECLTQQDPESVRWFEAGARGFVLHATPLSIAERFQAQLTNYPAAWIFCSGTLAVGGTLAHFKRELGILEAVEAVWPSPFDYSRQTLLYLPRIASDPSGEHYLTLIADCAEQVLSCSRGRAFFLFTSYRALEFCAARLRARLPWPVLVQGEAPRARLLAEFRELGNAVLFGTATFWEGVDVRGEALSCVIIDKLPFAPPDDPVARARAERLSSAGRSAFQELQLPAAVLTLKQGAGRLIRDAHDRGVLVLCDPRVRTRGYGKIFLKSLPPMPIVEDLAAVRAFFAPQAAAANAVKAQSIG